MRIAYIQDHYRIDSENKNQIAYTSSALSIRTHSQSHLRSRSHSHPPSHLHSHSHSHNEGNWAESLPLAVFFRMIQEEGGHTSTGDNNKNDNKNSKRKTKKTTTTATLTSTLRTQQVAADTTIASASAAAIAASAASAGDTAFVLLPFFIAFHILTQRKALCARFVRRSQLCFSARWILVDDGRAFVTTLAVQQPPNTCCIALYEYILFGALFAYWKM